MIYNIYIILFYKTIHLDSFILFINILLSLLLLLFNLQNILKNKNFFLIQIKYINENSFFNFSCILRLNNFNDNYINHHKNILNITCFYTVNMPKSNILERGTKTLAHILRSLFQKKFYFLLVKSMLK
jgi:hypothetical protein